MKKQKQNPVLFFKAQGQTSTLPKTLFNNDIAVGIQTSLQADMLTLLSKDSVICVDSTHGTTIIVIDEYGEGFPVA